MKKNIHIIVLGKVQGVAYRISAQEEAGRLGVTGFAMNCGDGSVCIEAEGEQARLDEFLEWCRSGPSGAEVQRVDSVPGEVRGYATFEIRRMNTQSKTS